MDRYYVYEWTCNSYIFIDTETFDLYFFSTNYANKMGEYHLENFNKESLSIQKINGLIKRINNGSVRNGNKSLAIDKFIYNLLMSEEQRNKCKPDYFILEYRLSLDNANFIASGNDYITVTKDMQRIVNSKSVA